LEGTVTPVPQSVQRLPDDPPKNTKISNSTNPVNPVKNSDYILSENALAKDAKTERLKDPKMVFEVFRLAFESGRL
jgi:hypothetical protein